jgi:hypothetical protein
MRGVVVAPFTAAQSAGRLGFDRALDSSDGSSEAVLGAFLAVSLRSPCGAF